VKEFMALGKNKMHSNKAKQAQGPREISNVYLQYWMYWRDNIMRKVRWVFFDRNKYSEAECLPSYDIPPTKKYQSTFLQKYFRAKSFKDKIALRLFELLFMNLVSLTHLEKCWQLKVSSDFSRLILLCVTSETRMKYCIVLLI